MAWENRGNGRYYYKKRRIGGRVVSEYIGSGALAGLIAYQDQEEQKRREAQRELLRLKREREAEQEAMINQVDDYARTVTKAALLLAGYHPHKGQWRRRRK